MKNKKGFTLIELLAVIVIIGVVMLIGTVSIGGARDKINSQMFVKKIDYVIGTAKIYGQDFREEIVGDYIVTIQDLINNRYLETDEKYNNQPAVLNDIKKSINGLQIKLYINSNRIYACIVNNNDNKLLLGTNSDSTFSDYFCK